MRYKPIESRSDALDRIAGLGYDEFSIVSYERKLQREQGEPDIEITRDANMPWTGSSHSAAGPYAWNCAASSQAGAKRPSALGGRPGSERGRGSISNGRNRNRSRIPSRVPAAGGGLTPPQRQRQADSAAVRTAEKMPLCKC